MNSKEIISKIITGEQLTFTETFSSDVDLDFKEIVFDQIGRITFTDCVFNAEFGFSNLEKSNSSIRFINCIFTGISSISEVKISDLKFRNCSFNESCSIRNSEISELQIHECDLPEGLFSLYKVTSLTTNITWETEDPKMRLSIDVPETEDLYIASRGNVKMLMLYNVKHAEVLGSYEFLMVYTQKCDSINIENYVPNRKSDSELIYKKIYDLRQVDQIFNGKLKIEDLEIETLFLYNVDSPHSISLIELQIVKAHFYDVNIKSFYWNQLEFKEYLSIERGDLSTLKASNIQWLKGKRMSHSFLDEPVPLFYLLKKKWLKVEDQYDKDDVIQLQYERETYRQLKSAFSATNNHIESLDFYKNEMRLLWKELRINGGIPFGDRVLIFLNRWSSNFGQSWALPLLWIFIFHSLLYFWIINFQIKCNWSEFKLGFGQYFELLNPVHKTPNYVKGFAIGIEFFMRVIDGFLIYHFVRATRKFGKI